MYHAETEPAASNVHFVIPHNASVLYNETQNITGSMEVDNSVVSPLVRCFVDDVMVDCRQQHNTTNGMAITSFRITVPRVAFSSLSTVRVEAYLPPNDIVSSTEVDVNFGKSKSQQIRKLICHKGRQQL